jgi:putative MATE family efflux protein
MLRANLTEGSVSGRLTKLTLPMIWGVFMVLSFNLVDTFFIGLLGAQELAAISFTFPVVMVIASIAMGLGVGASSVIARTIGRDDQEKIRRIATHSLILSLIIVGVLVVVGYSTIDLLFTALGANDSLLPLIRQYMEIWYCGMIFLVVPMVGNSIIRASGDAIFPSLIMTVAAVGNLILDPILIFGLAGFPRLELQGAALASVISRAVTLTASLLVLHYRLRLIEFIMPRWNQLWQSWRAVLHVGLPAAGTNVIIPLFSAFLTYMIAAHGAEAVAAYGVASRIEMFFLLPFIAISAAIGPFMGQNIGAKKIHRLLEALKVSSIFSLLWGGLIALILWFGGRTIVSYVNSDSNVISNAAIYMALVPISYSAVGLLLTSGATFNAVGKPLPATAIALGRTFLITIPLAWAGNRIWGLSGIFASIAIANISVGLVAAFWVRRTIRSYPKPTT